MALKILRMLKNNWKKLVMLKKTMLLFFMPLLINCLIKNRIKNSYVIRSLLNFNCCTSCLLPEEKIEVTVDTTEETNGFADDFGFSVAGVDFILHSRRYAYVAGVRHLRDETKNNKQN